MTIMPETGGLLNSMQAGVTRNMFSTNTEFTVVYMIYDSKSYYNHGS